MDKKNVKLFASIKSISKGKLTLAGINNFKVVANRWKQTEKFLDIIMQKEEGHHFFTIFHSLQGFGQGI